MEMTQHTTITVETTIKAPVAKVWKYWSTPAHITKWCSASDDWHAPFAENDSQTGGKFLTRMEAKDGSFGFDFGGVYDEVRENEYIQYTLGDGRKVVIEFTPIGKHTRIAETFDMENTHSEEMQRGGWQSILDNFKKYMEGN
jgi:uncharacterized protein YndB with AHSA1/START domain